VPAATLAPPLGQAWRGRAAVPKERQRRRWLTVVGVGTAGHAEPWLLVTGRPPRVGGVLWYGRRMGIAGGVRALKALGGDGEHTRRQDPTRGARPGRVLAVAHGWVVTAATAAADAGRARPTPPARPGQRPVRLVQRGRATVLHGCRGLPPWPPRRLVPKALPSPPADRPLPDHVPAPRHDWADAYLPR